VARGVLHVVGGRDLAVVDEVRDALCVPRIRRVRGVISDADGARGVGEELVREAELLGERLVLFDRVEADAEDFDAGLIELLDSIPESTSLLRSAGGVGLGIEPEDDLLVLVVVELHGRSVVGDDREPGCFRSDVEHGYGKS
jgi:hypothetical protein